MDKIRLLITDDHPMMREALLTALAEETDMEVVGEASNGIEALKLMEKCQPDVILMDLLMPGMDGLEATSRILEANPQAKILVVTSLEDEDKVLAAIQAGRWVTSRRPRRVCICLKPFARWRMASPIFRRALHRNYLRESAG